MIRALLLRPRFSLADLIWIITNVTFQQWNVVATKVVLVMMSVLGSEKWLPFIQTCFCGRKERRIDIDKSSWLLFFAGFPKLKGHGTENQNDFVQRFCCFVNYSFATSIGNKIYIWISYKKWEVEKFKLHNQPWNAFIFHFSYLKLNAD